MQWHVCNHSRGGAGECRELRDQMVWCMQWSTIREHVLSRMEGKDRHLLCPLTSTFLPGMHDTSLAMDTQRHTHHTRSCHAHTRTDKWKMLMAPTFIWAKDVECYPCPAWSLWSDGSWAYPTSNSPFLSPLKLSFLCFLYHSSWLFDLFIYLFIRS